MTRNSFRKPVRMPRFGLCFLALVNGARVRVAGIVSSWNGTGFIMVRRFGGVSVLGVVTVRYQCGHGSDLQRRMGIIFPATSCVMNWFLMPPWLLYGITHAWRSIQVASPAGSSGPVRP